VEYYTAPDFSSLKERIYAACPKDSEAQECIRWITEFEKDRGAYRDALDSFNEGMKMGKNFSNMNGNKQSIVEFNMDTINTLGMNPDNLTDEEKAFLFKMTEWQCELIEAIWPLYCGGTPAVKCR